MLENQAYSLRLGRYTLSIGSNRPGLSRTVLDLLTLSCILDSPAICPGCWSSRVKYYYTMSIDTDCNSYENYY